jgi:hypothetical protein
MHADVQYDKTWVGVLDFNSGGSMIQKTAILMTVILLMVASLAVAGEKKAEMKAEMKGEMKAVDGIFEGKLVCLACDLKETEGARAECSVYGHKHALKTSDGRYINLLENKYSADLLNSEKYAGKDIKIQGVYYASANQLDVQSFTVGDKTMSWCDHCKTMDGCMAGKGGI